MPEPMMVPTMRATPLGSVIFRFSWTFSSSTSTGGFAFTSVALRDVIADCRVAAESGAERRVAAASGAGRRVAAESGARRRVAAEPGAASLDRACQGPVERATGAAAAGASERLRGFRGK